MIISPFKVFFYKELIKRVFQSSAIRRKSDFDIEKQIILTQIWQLTTAFLAILSKSIDSTGIKLPYMIRIVILLL